MVYLDTVYSEIKGSESWRIVYKNEKQVGDGLKLASLPRSDIWVTTKFSGLKTVKESIKDSLEWLGLEYVDLYLIHNPAWGGDIKDTWREMRGVKKEGWAKSIGVSKYVSSDPLGLFVETLWLWSLMAVSRWNNLKKSSTIPE